MRMQRDICILPMPTMLVDFARRIHQPALRDDPRENGPQKMKSGSQINLFQTRVSTTIFILKWTFKDRTVSKRYNNQTNH